jgi:hypothetical protein
MQENPHRLRESSFACVKHAPDPHGVLLLLSYCAWSNPLRRPGQPPHIGLKISHPCQSRLRVATWLRARGGSLTPPPC